MALESKVENRLTRGVEHIGGKCYKWVCPGNSGVPDRIVILPGGRIVFVELKQEGENPRPLQRLVHRKLKNLGCDVRALAGMKEVEQFLEGIKG